MKKVVGAAGVFEELRGGVRMFVDGGMLGTGSWGFDKYCFNFNACKSPGNLLGSSRLATNFAISTLSYLVVV